jgi:hypothetical protein
LRLRGLEDREHSGGAAEMEKAAEIGGGRLVVTGAEAEEVAKLVMAATEALGDLVAAVAHLGRLRVG